MSMIANYCKEISGELDWQVTPQTPLRELELVAEMRWLRTMLREAKQRLDEVEDLELELFTLKDQLDEYKNENDKLVKENALLESELEINRENIKKCVLELGRQFAAKHGVF